MVHLRSVKLPSKLTKILSNVPPCQKRQLEEWFKYPTGIQSFFFCLDQPCEPCLLYRSTMVTICPYCSGSSATTVVVPKNGIALCRKVQCKCTREYRIVFTRILCEVCELKANCLSIPIAIPELCLHEKIK